MTARFDYFVVFAEMRTGSNFLETNLNALSGVRCLGEAFNPYFVGYPKADDVLGITQAMREADPGRLIDAVKSAEGLAGFRYFNDHDPRVFDTIVDNPRCAKIILTRNPAESYVSWKIAQATGQWKLTNVSRRKKAQAQFDAAEFDRHVGTLQAFQVELLGRLQRSGQTAFYVDYEDLRSLEVMNGLAMFLGVDARLDALDASLKVQNPEALSEKVFNYAEMETALAGVDRFNLTRTPNFEPRRAAAVPTYVTSDAPPLLFLPVQGGPVTEVEAWMSSLGGEIHRGMNQKRLRQWKRKHPGHRSFTVLRHPLARAYHVFCTRVLSTGDDAYPQIRRVLRKHHDVALPADGPGPDWTATKQREAFAGFLRFLKRNLSGQTAVRVDASWASQSHVVQGFAGLALPDMLVRESDMQGDLAGLARRAGVENPARPQVAPQDTPIPLADIHDADLEDLAQAAYQRDYMIFGFGPWSG